jgi:hypothetical protein
MDGTVIQLSLNPGTCTDMDICYVRHEGKYLVVYKDAGCTSDFSRINIPLFYKIALYTVERRSYKNIIRRFYEELKDEGIRGMFKTRETMEKAGMAFGKPGGRVAFLVGILCRYFGKLPRNVNVVHSNCEWCKNTDISLCGKKSRCGEYYGCGGGVTCPMPTRTRFNVDDIPKIREEIKKEIFLEPVISS